MTKTLLNKRILVTRPKHQADKLCELITAYKGQPVSFPSIEIQAIETPDNRLGDNDTLLQYDFIIFVSRNAVNITFERYANLANLSADIQLVAIGAGTAEALTELSIENVLHAGLQAQSEALLELPEMQAERLADKKILIVRGLGGREYLRDNLVKRGATVDYAEVYKRCLPKYEANDVHNLWQNIKPDAAIVSSNDGLRNLVSLTAELGQEQLFNLPLVLMSERSITLARELGFTSRINAAVDKNDQGLLQALLDLAGE